MEYSAGARGMTHLPDCFCINNQPIFMCKVHRTVSNECLQGQRYVTNAPSCTQVALSIVYVGRYLVYLASRWNEEAKQTPRLQSHGERSLLRATISSLFGKPNPWLFPISASIEYKRILAHERNSKPGRAASVSISIAS